MLRESGFVVLCASHVSMASPFLAAHVSRAALFLWLRCFSLRRFSLRCFNGFAVSRFAVSMASLFLASLFLAALFLATLFLAALFLATPFLATPFLGFYVLRTFQWLRRLNACGVFVQKIVNCVVNLKYYCIFVKSF